MELVEINHKPYVRVAEVLKDMGAQVTEQYVVDKAIAANENKFKEGTDYYNDRHTGAYWVNRAFGEQVVQANQRQSTTFGTRNAIHHIEEAFKDITKVRNYAREMTTVTTGSSPKVVAKIDATPVAKNEVKEDTDAEICTVEGNQTVRDGVILGEDSRIDYTKRLDMGYRYGFTAHALTRADERLDYPVGTNLVAYLRAMLIKSGLTAVQEDGLQLWGNGKVFFLVSTERMNVITILTKGMRFNGATKVTFHDLEDEVNSALAHITLQDNRKYWNDLAESLQKLGAYVTEKGESLKRRYRIKTPSGISQLTDEVDEITSTYRDLVNNTDRLISEHKERQGYLNGLK